MIIRKYKSLDDFDPDDFRKTLPRFQGENFAKNLKLVDKFREFAKKKGVTPSQLCLAWVLAQVNLKIYNVLVYIFLTY